MYVINHCLMCCAVCSHIQKTFSKWSQSLSTRTRIELLGVFSLAWYLLINDHSAIAAIAAHAHTHAVHIGNPQNRLHSKVRVHMAAQINKPAVLCDAVSGPSHYQSSAFANWILLPIWFDCGQLVCQSALDVAINNACKCAQDAHTHVCVCVSQWRSQKEVLLSTQAQFTSEMR